LAPLVLTLLLIANAYAFRRFSRRCRREQIDGNSRGRVAARPRDAFASAALASAITSIQAYRPKIIAIDAIFAETPSGAAFIDQVDPLTRGAVLSC